MILRQTKRQLSTNRPKRYPPLVQRAWRRLWTAARIRRHARAWAHQARQTMTDGDLLALTEGQWGDVSHLFHHLAMKASPLFANSDAREATAITAIQTRYPTLMTDLVKQAQAICRHEFSLLGHNYTGDQPLDWHKAPDSGRPWPLDFVETIDRWLWCKPNPGDLKVIWELNRHQHFVTLAQAYWLTGNERYAIACGKQLRSWVRTNPPGFGIHWYSSLEIALRLVAWSTAFQWLRHSHPFRTRSGPLLLKSLYQQTNYLAAHLTTDWPVPNNHLIGEAAALVIVGALFAEFRDAEQWRAQGLAILQRELIRQISTDGVHKEQSTWYHRFVLDLLLPIELLARNSALPQQPMLSAKVEQMLTYLQWVALPDGTLPQLGDADDGHGILLNPVAPATQWHDWLALGALLWARPDFKGTAARFGPAAYWLLGERGHAAFDALPASTPERTATVFPGAGHYIIRDKWDDTSDHLLFRCGSFGLGGAGFCTHAHCDQLSVLLTIKGHPVFVDSGTYTYHGTERNAFRATAAHNTVLIDECEQAIPKDLFHWEKVRAGHCTGWTGMLVRGQYTSPTGVDWQRKVDHPRPGTWVVADSFVGKGKHKLEWFFHLDPHWRLVQRAEGTIEIVDATGSLAQITPPRRGVQLLLCEAWVATGYGSRCKGPLLYGHWEGQLLHGESEFQWHIKWLI